MRNCIMVGALASASLLGFMQPASAAVTFDWATVGNANNAADPATGNVYGSVDRAYRISKTEVTNAQYVEFLNAVDAWDIDGLYNSAMNSDTSAGGITRSGTAGSYTYAAKDGRGQHPVVYVSWNDAARFVNWLSNGQQSGAAGAASVESGVYDMTQPGNPSRAGNATIFLPTENEWYKAAYYDPTLNSGNGGYYTYATRSDTTPTAEAPLGGSNSANYSYAGYNVATGYLTDVGAYADSTSYYGTFDQNGNASEWNEAVISQSYRGLRGGSWYYDSTTLAASSRGAFNPSLDNLSVGFRVASLPEPGSCMILLGLAGAALTRRRRAV